jgi:ATP-dependent helicase/nuclease subunit A
MTRVAEIFQQLDNNKFATDTGVKIHKKLQYISEHTDTELFKKISADKTLSEFFGANSKTEVPIAGTINGKFISRRIDRLYINNSDKIIAVIDYKTDVNRETFYNTYVYQVSEYISLLRNIYPDYRIDGYILWTHDFLLEKIPTKHI